MGERSSGDGGEDLGNPSWSDNWTTGHPALHGEIMDVESRSVWLCQQPISYERYDALALPDGFIRTGIGGSTADLAYFRRSPGRDSDGPLQVRDIDGVRFSFVATPGEPEAMLPGLVILPVSKHHRVLYRAGRAIEIMDCGDGFDYVPLVAEARMAGRRRDRPLPPRTAPKGWSSRFVTLARNLLVELPCPTRVTFFASGESFQGPVRLGL
ncbi:MAG TPA: hypothetical protein VGK20_12705 [Candidatus Binatia bacterium]